MRYINLHFTYLLTYLLTKVFVVVTLCCDCRQRSCVKAVMYVCDSGDSGDILAVLKYMPVILRTAAENGQCKPQM